jgi:hypothetical protein
MIAIVTTMKLVSAWVSVGLVFISITAGIWVGHYVRQLITALLLDAIQIWAAWQQARFDASYRQKKAELVYAEMRLSIQTERKNLLAQMEELL